MRARRLASKGRIWIFAAPSGKMLPMDPIRLSNPPSPASRAPRPVASSEGQGMGPQGASPSVREDLAAFQAYARARGLSEDALLPGVQAILDSPGPLPSRQDRAPALLTLLEVFPPPKGVPLSRCPHKEVLEYLADMLVPPRNDVERKGMTTTSHVTTYRPEETTVVHVRRADTPPGSFLEAVEDFVAVAGLVGKGFRRERPDNLADVRYGAQEALRVEYQGFYRDPALTPIFRGFVSEVGRSNYAWTLVQETRDWPDSERQALCQAHSAVHQRSGSDQAWRCMRLAMTTRQPGESFESLALDIDQAWAKALVESPRLASEYPGLPALKLEPVMVRAAEERPAGEGPSQRMGDLVEGYYLTGRLEGMAPLREALEQAYPVPGLPPELRGKIADTFYDSVRSRRRQGLDPETSLKRALEDCRILLTPTSPGSRETPGTIERDGEHVRIGGIKLDVRRK